MNRKEEVVKIESPQEYKHTLATILNGLVSRNFEIVKFQEERNDAYDSQLGSWEHYTSCAPPWLYLLSRKK